MMRGLSVVLDSVPSDAGLVSHVCLLIQNVRILKQYIVFLVHTVQGKVREELFQ